MKDLVKKYKYLIGGIIIGAVGGFLYWMFIGCDNGTCAIKSNAGLMTGYGALVGVLLGSVVRDFLNKRKSKPE